MLYGLINPYILETLLNLKLGPLAPYVLRLVQFLIAITGFIFLSLAVSHGKKNTQLRFSFFSTIVVVLSSTVILIESFEPTPENITLCIMNILFYLMTIYKPDKRQGILIGLILAFLAGTRPTALLLALPVFLVITGHSPAKSYARRYWRWVVLVVISCIALLTAFPEIISVGKLGLIAIPILLYVTLISFIHDRKNGYIGVWKELLLIVVSSCVLLPILFPNYFLHFKELLRQVNQYHLEVEFPCDSIPLMTKNIFYSLLYITIVFPGSFAATGFFTAVGLFISKRKAEYSNYRTLALFAVGIVPFILIVIRNDNFQSRYLIPVMGLIFAVASIGIRYLLKSKLKYLLLIPFLVSSFQLYEIVHHKTNGGVLNAFYDLSMKEQGTINAQDIGPCHPHYYGNSGNSFYPLLPYVSSNWHIMNSQSTFYFISFNMPPTGFDVIGTYGNDLRDRARQVRNSNYPGWAEIIYLTGKPWIWRGWSVAYFAIMK
ncbi:MAG: hypothetical protein KAR40_01800 [Candidatus Sabulitectum sp.]|nr:hypothetical protein [Candidatus Sabulitectum sp.]